MSLLSVFDESLKPFPIKRKPKIILRPSVAVESSVVVQLGLVYAAGRTDLMYLSLSFCWSCHVYNNVTVVEVFPNVAVESSLVAYLGLVYAAGRTELN